MRSESPTHSTFPMSSSRGDLHDPLRRAIRGRLAEGAPSVGRMADLFGLSQRTLQRRLSETGKSYRELVQEARIDLATDLLRNSERRLADIALAAGYSDQAHFNRAFRRQTGVTPGMYRLALRADWSREH